MEDDRCLDSNAMCTAGLCTCINTYFSSGGKCSKITSTTTIFCEILNMPIFDILHIKETSCPFFFSVPKIGLGNYCSAQDVCVDENAYCYNNKCTCKTSYYFKAGQCCKLSLSLLSSSIKILIKSVVKNNCCFPIVGQKKGLLQSCSIGDVCVDINAQCRSGYCQCMGTFKIIGNRCSKQKYFQLIHKEILFEKKSTTLAVISVCQFLQDNSPLF